MPVLRDHKTQTLANPHYVCNVTNWVNRQIWGKTNQRILLERANVMLWDIGRGLVKKEGVREGCFMSKIPQQDFEHGRGAVVL